jgi:hypothetical protein
MGARIKRRQLGWTVSESIDGWMDKANNELLERLWVTGDWDGQCQSLVSARSA